MSERSERIIVTAPEAHGCTTPQAPDAPAYDAMVHR